MVVVARTGAFFKPHHWPQIALVWTPGLYQPRFVRDFLCQIGIDTVWGETVRWRGGSVGALVGQPHTAAKVTHLLGPHQGRLWGEGEGVRGTG